MKQKIEKVLYFGIISVFTVSTTAIASQTDDAVSNLNGGVGVYGTLIEIMSIMAWVGVAIAILKMMQIGIKYMTQPANGRGQAKDSLIPWFVGAFVLATFGTLAPWLIGMIEPSGSSDGGIFNI